MDESVSYKKSDNRFLRLALLEAWKNACYWCKKPVDYTITQIDHILPKSLKGKELTEALASYGLRDDYDLHAPYNLAPICSPCNGPGEKGQLFKPGVPIFLSKLDKAQKLEGAVIKAVLKMEDSPVLAENIIKVAAMNIDEQEPRALFEDHAPAIVQKLANLGSDALEYTTSMGLFVDPSESSSYVDVFLNDRDRMTKGIIDGLIEQSFEGVLREVVSNLDSQIQEKVTEAFTALPSQPYGEDPRELVVGPWADLRKTTVLTNLDFSRDDESVKFTFAGSFSSEYLASVVRSSEDGSSLEYGDGSVYVDLEWTVTSSWDGQYESLLEVVDVDIVINNDVEKALSWT